MSPLSVDDSCFYPEVIWQSEKWKYKEQKYWQPKICRTGVSQSPIDIPRKGEWRDRLLSNVVVHIGELVMAKLQ